MSDDFYRDKFCEAEQIFMGFVETKIWRQSAKEGQFPTYMKGCPLFPVTIQSRLISRTWSALIESLLTIKLSVYVDSSSSLLQG